MLDWVKEKLFKRSKSKEDFEQELSQEVIPNHIAVIMDGNGRWAQQRDLARSRGHQRGVNTLKEIVRTAADLGVDYFTVYAFSTENWKRPSKEVEFLMDLFKKTFQQELDNFQTENIKVKVIGYKDRLPQTVLDSIEKLTAVTKDNTGLQLNIALDYGGRAEIVEAAKSLANKIEKDELQVEDITEEKFSQQLYITAGQEVDLLIRPGGEKRISNFLLWQLAYSELYFTDTYWPEFSEVEFKAAIKEYQNRNRRYGGIQGK
ncbi:MAG: isoprenyl transferase [Bacillota bacterium]